MTLEEIITQANYLIRPQKDRLIEDLESGGFINSQPDLGELLDTISRSFFSCGLDDWSPIERQELNRILGELGFRMV